MSPNINLISCRVTAIFLMLAIYINANADGLVIESSFRTGVNLANPGWVSLDSQNSVIEQLKNEGVKIIRGANLSSSDEDIAFLKHAFDSGIGFILVVDPIFPSDVKVRKYDPVNYPEFWSVPGLSYADLKMSQRYLKDFLEKIDRAGIALQGIELGNEFNWVAFNQDFPLPGKGKVFELPDLYEDPEAMVVANGFKKYINLLVDLKGVRDSLNLNRKVPIVLGGIGQIYENWPNSIFQKKTDSVSVNATIEFLRSLGLDELVDVYGIHYYPNPNFTSEQRKAFFKDKVMKQCSDADSGFGKPCWITEWGVENKDDTCYPNENQRLPLMVETLGEFDSYSKLSRLDLVILFSWGSWPGQVLEPFSVYRCGQLLSSGRIALRH
jgi:hypothetical protein